VDVTVVVPDVPQICSPAFSIDRNDDLEIAVRRTKAALDHDTRSFDTRSHYLTFLPRLVHIRIVMPVMLQDVAPVWQAHEGAHLEVEMCPTAEIALDQATGTEYYVRRVVDPLARPPRLVDIRIIVPVMPQFGVTLIVDDRHGDLEIPVAASPEITLDDRRRPGDSATRFRNALALLPGFADSRVIVPEMPQFDIAADFEHRHNDLEVAVATRSEIALDDGTWKGCLVCHDALAALPRLPRRGIVAPPVREIASFDDDSFKILMVTAEITLNEAFE